MFTIQQMIERRQTTLAEVRAAIAPQLAQRGTHSATIQTIRETVATAGRAMTTDEERQVNEADNARRAIDTATAPQRAEIDRLVREIDDLVTERAADEDATRAAGTGSPTGAPPAADRAPVVVNREERTYTPEKSNRGEASFFADAYGAQRGNRAAADRLERNLAEALVEREVSERATSTSSFAGLVVPQYLVDMAALVIRSGRPLANAVTGLPLPSQGMTVDIPRGTTGAAVASQATENTALQNTDEVMTDLIVPVRTVGGQQDVSRQSLERGTPGIDSIIYMDLAGAYHAELDRQVANGSGASGQMLGIFQTAGINAATAYGAAINFQSFNSKVAGQVAAIAGQGAGIVPRLIVMNPRRWGWMTSLVDSAGRPLVIPTAQGVFNAGAVNANPAAYGGDNGATDTGGTTIVGTMQGLPITTDANVPTNIGTNLEDLVGVLDTTKAILWEDGDGQPRELRFEQTLGNQLTVKLVIYGYAAFTAGRYPQAFSKIGGLDTGAGFGQVAPTF